MMAAPQVNQENVDPQIEFLLYKQWALYSVTPLYKFSYGQLQEYSRQLSMFIAAEKQKGQAVQGERTLAFKVEFSSVPTLKITPQDQAAVFIQVAAESAEDKVVWTGWFCCTCGDSILKTGTKDFTCLPLFLTNGTERFSGIVGTWFQQTFDCSFRPLPISPLNLAWMAAMWTGFEIPHCTAATELTFSVPDIPYPLTISYAIHPKDAKALWDSISRIPGEVQQEEVDIFMEYLYGHFYNHFHIYLSATRLTKVSTSVATVHSDGRIKIRHIKPLISILSLLTELAISQLL